MKATTMKYASILKAEPGWQALVVDREGRQSRIAILSWGMSRNTMIPLAPLNDLGHDIRHQANFVAILDPNEKQNQLHLKAMVEAKVRELLQLSVAKELVSTG